MGCVRRSALALALALALATALGVFAAETHAQSCRIAKPSGPVSVLILDSPQKVEEFAASVRSAGVTAQERGLVIFDDGRVVTSDVAAATERLNALGWGNRPLEIVASFRIRPNPPPGAG